MIWYLDEMLMEKVGQVDNNIHLRGREAPGCTLQFDQVFSEHSGARIHVDQLQKLTKKFRINLDWKQDVAI